MLWLTAAIVGLVLAAILHAGWLASVGLVAAVGIAIGFGFAAGQRLARRSIATPTDRRATASAAHAAEQPAGDVQRLAVHVVGPRRAEEEDAAGGLLR